MAINYDAHINFYWTTFTSGNRLTSSSSDQPRGGCSVPLSHQKAKEYSSPCERDPCVLSNLLPGSDLKLEVFLRENELPSSIFSSRSSEGKSSNYHVPFAIANRVTRCLCHEIIDHPSITANKLMRTGTLEGWCKSDEESRLSMKSKNEEPRMARAFPPGFPFGNSRREISPHFKWPFHNRAWIPREIRGKFRDYPS